jgi:phospholipid/cholesterol/gamma-HCH transport system substrate-binding protein
MTNRNALVGLFVLGGVILFTVGVFFVGNRHEAFERHIQLYTELGNLSGLTNGSKVRVAGMDAGEIVGVEVPDSPSSRFRIKFQIDEKLRGLVRTDSIVTVATEGVVGGTYLLIRPGSKDAQRAAPFTTLPSQEPVDMSKLLERGVGLLNDADVTVKQVGEKLDGALDGITTTVGNANDLVVGLKQGRGLVGMLLQDQRLSAQIQQVVANAHHATSVLDHASSQADEFITDFQSRRLPAKADETMGIVKDAATNIDSSTKQLQQTITEAVGPDREGVVASANISESLSNLNAASANMADDTEALKHNFFFRGFFRHRGYYNLTHIDPDQYSKDKLFTDPANYRVWLPATDLFRKDDNAVETLSSKGKQILNAAISQYGESVVERPMVIEAYSNAGNAAEQLSSSHHRAILVRLYLQSHFRLDGDTIGVVSMKKFPVESAAVTPLDGICIVVLSRHQ